MKKTRYFVEQVLVKRPYIKEDWVFDVLTNPIKKEIQPEGRIRFWGFIKELNKYLRVVTLEDGETVHNVFPDRNFKED
ncbi:MAG: hypothetical protein Q8N03_00755 [Ignavibacteria bacterium]|nr:hypothetical protein [Ignavibacteria bacterium]